MSLAFDRIRDYLAYDAETGKFTWIAKPKGRGYPFKVGDEAGCIRPDGRRVICFSGQLYLASRLAWYFECGVLLPPEIGIDHRNRDPGDDRIDNLRTCDQERNMLNTVAHQDSASSMFKGVSWHKNREKWVASFRGRYLGIYADEEDAARAYDRAALAYDPAFARPNFSKEGTACRAL